ncbi:hypothetical protein O6H91_05G110300 [Diphasiastrum complanatum]|uniref:Uncharacterized protein n=2 Tax=Diphasiastrum complanatum TaxID=34168 RepID=A0ACC2DSK1_DIPCM|nr:hypothetical protein O6H91_05G110300 [Diphasiastrum complanatum]KAJ7557063.1 hypothetical protein O6H91_05G110300 [Diphasiastrum complanatum]
MTARSGRVGQVRVYLSALGTYKYLQSSMESTLTSLAAGALADIQQVFQMAEKSGQDPLHVIVEEILHAKAGNIVLYGVGREGLMMKALCMRLFHLGLKSHFFGDMTTPAIGPGDLFVASAGPGSFHTVNALLQVARDAGARVMVITAQKQGSAAKLAHAVAVVPAQTMADDMRHSASDRNFVKASNEGVFDEQMQGKFHHHSSPDVTATSLFGGLLPMGSVYEGALFVLFEVTVHCLQSRLGETSESMRSRHTNLE